MLPRCIKIGSQTYAVRLASCKRMGDDMAEVDSVTNTILLRRPLSKSRRAECLLHECVHAMLCGHNNLTEEIVANVLGEGLAQLVRDNPQLFAYLKDALSK